MKRIAAKCSKPDLYKQSYSLSMRKVKDINRDLYLSSNRETRKQVLKETSVETKEKMEFLRTRAQENSAKIKYI